MVRDAVAINRSLIPTFAPESTVRRDFAQRLYLTVSEHGGRLRSVRLDVSEVNKNSAWET